MGKHSVIEMIDFVKDKLGDNEAFNALEIDKTTYYNYKKGGNPNRKKLAKIVAVYNRYSTEVPPGNGDSWNLAEAEVSYKTKIPTDEAGLIKELLESQRARIKLLEERQQSETRLIQVEATLQIVVGILNGLKIPEQSHTPSDPGEGIGEVALRSKVADKNESSGPKVGRK